MDQKLGAIPEGDKVIVGGCLNGHVGIRKLLRGLHVRWLEGEGVGRKKTVWKLFRDVGRRTAW